MAKRRVTARAVVWGLLSLLVAPAGCALRGAPSVPPAQAIPSEAPGVAAAPMDAIPPTPVVTADDRKRFLGNQACIGCHQGPAALHNRSTHAHTLMSALDPKPRASFQAVAPVEDARLKVRYSFRVEGKKPIYHVERTNTGSSIDVVPRFCLGSGRIGRTFLLEKGGVYMEARTSYYSKGRQWAWTPGQTDGSRSSSPVGSTMSFDRTVSCFLCHSTAVVLAGKQVIPEQSIFNVGCERCHGAGREHVEAVKSGNGVGKIFSLRNASAESIMRLCGDCHRAPVNLPESQLASYAELPRFAGPGLSISKCYKLSGGKLSCVTCHQPHSAQVKSFDAPCMNCHTGAAGKWRPCPVNTKSGCVSCHMPLMDVNLPVDRKFRTHWIKAYPSSITSSAANIRP